MNGDIEDNVRESWARMGGGRGVEEG